MSFRALVYAYVFGGLTFIPLVILGLVFFTIYTSVPVGNLDPAKKQKAALEQRADGGTDEKADAAAALAASPLLGDQPRSKRGWLTMRRTFEESSEDGSYVALVRGFLDARSKDPKRSRPKDMWYVVLKGTVLYLYDDEAMTECEAALEMGRHDVVIYPEGQMDGELFAKRTAICLKPKVPPPDGAMASVTKEMKLADDGATVDEQVEEAGGSAKKKDAARERLLEAEKRRETAREEALNPWTPWFIFVRSNVDMEDWYMALVHASDNAAATPMLAPLKPIFEPADMAHLVGTLDDQPDVIPTRWLNALIGRIFFSYYRTQTLESYIIGRLMKKLSKVKRPSYLSDIVVKEVSVGNRPPTFSKPMLKELTQEGDTALEVHLHYKGEIRVTIEATATINLGARFKSYTVKLVLAAVLREIEGNLLVKVKRPPSSRIWYAFTAMPKMVLDVEPIVSDRQITWSMILTSIESRLKEVILESIVLPNMDDISFFDSEPYHHRGGIWADACRRAAASASGSQDPRSDEESPSVPQLDIRSESLPEPATAVVDDLAIPRAASPEPWLGSNAKSASAPPEAGGLLATAGLGSKTSSTSSSNKSTRRRTWLSSISHVNEGGSVDTLADQARAPEHDKSTGPYSQSAPSQATFPSDPSLASTRPDGRLSPGVSRRSSQNSQSSSPRERTTSSPSMSNALDSEFEPTPTPSTSAPSTPSNGSKLAARSSGLSDGAAKGANQTASFLASLKSRAASADKQAISNQAKEAMRKWGMNWSRLRRDTPGSESDEPGDAGSDTTGDAHSHHSGSSSRTPSMHRPRTNYAEIRAKVEDRRAGKGEGGSGSLPVEIPDGGAKHTHRRRERPVSSGSVSSYDARSSTPGEPASPPNPASPPRTRVDSLTAAGIVPAVPRATTALHAQSVSPSTSPSAGAAAPIHTQPPQAKSMTIPGIHARHRGEVMAMGYKPPSPPPTPQADPKAKVAALVYNRLWKSPAQGHGQSQSQPALEHETAGGHDDGLEQDELTPMPGDDASPVPAPVPVPAQAASTPAGLGLGAPPPLPPRRSSASSTPRSATPASAALQRIVSQDEVSRAGSAPPGQAEGAPPPLPPRKMPAVA